MDADAYIRDAIARGQARGIGSLDALQRLVWMISEAEACCDDEGIEALIGRHGVGSLPDFAQAFHTIGASEIAQALAQIPIRKGEYRRVSLDLANSLIRGRVGYSHASIRQAVARGA